MYDQAIKIDPKYVNAYFYKGFNYKCYYNN